MTDPPRSNATANLIAATAGGDESDAPKRNSPVTPPRPSR